MMSLTDLFLPARLADKDGLETKRARICIQTVAFLVLWGPIAALIYWFGGSPDAVVTVLTGAALLATAPFVLRWTGSLTTAGTFTLVTLSVLLMTLSVFFGGLEAPPLSWMLLVPVFAVLFHGIKVAAAWLGVVLICWAGFAVAEFSGYEFAQQLGGGFAQAHRIIEMVGLGAVVFVMFVLKDSLQEWLIGTVRQKEAETRAVLETAPDGILTVDTDGEIMSANQAAARLFGRDEDDVVGQPIDEMISSLEAKRIGQTAAQTAPDSSQEHTGQRNGQQFPAEVAFGTLGGKQDGVVLVLRDITERKEAEQQLKDARDEALEASRAKSSFLANMSHELRTPLNAVIGYSEMIMEEIGFIQDSDEPGAQLVGEFVPDLTRIRTAGKHLLSIINDILDLSKIEAGKMTTHIELFDVRDLLDDITGTIQPLANKNHNTLELDLGSEVRFMRSDQTKVRQILFNLLSNACKFTDGGTVQMRAELDEEANQLVFEVEDNGIGMTAEQVDKVFEAFTQADSSTTREFGGTGLGLTITSHFCALLGGDIAVQSAPDEGTTFTVRLAADMEGDADALEAPEATTDTLVEAANEPTAQPSAGQDTILVIDDDPTMRDLLRRVLEREGFHVVTAASGSEGLLLAEQLEPSAITLDVMMPSMDGWTMLSKLKERPELAHIPVVMVTMVSESARGYALGADHYLVKPVDRTQLVEVLDAYRSTRAGGGDILLIEDDEPTRSLIRRTLENDGWQVTEAENGQIGLDKLDEVDPDLVLLDLMMPKMDGFEFLRHFRSDDAYRDVPVVVVTAKELTAEDEAELRTGVSDILAKGGYDKDELLEQVRDQVMRVARGPSSEE